MKANRTLIIGDIRKL